MDSEYLRFNVKKGEAIYEIQLQKVARDYSTDPVLYAYKCSSKNFWDGSIQHYRILLPKKIVDKKILNRFEANIVCARLVYELIETDKTESILSENAISTHFDVKVASKEKLRYEVLRYIKEKYDESPETATNVFEILAVLNYSPSEIVRAIKNLFIRKLISVSGNLQDYEQIKQLEEQVDFYNQLSTVLSTSFVQIDQIEQKLSEFERKSGANKLVTAITGTKDMLDQKGIKIFLSYSTRNKKTASDLKDHLEEYGLDVFLAHQTIKVSQQWEDRIRQELHDCQVFIALITTSFIASKWTDQEAGFAMAYGKKIIPVLSSGRNPHGFLNRYQGEPLKRDKTITTKQIIQSIVEDDKLNQSFRNGLIKKFGSSKSFDETHETIDKIIDISGYSSEQLDQMETYIETKRQVRGAFKTESVLEPFIEKERK